jgi:hypothetical protein
LLLFDFLKFDIRVCSGIWLPNSKESDYESWSPNECFAGKKMTFIRQKDNVECFNQDIDRPTIEYYCECTQNDYECDIGFKMDEDTKSCIEIVEGIL